MVTIIGSARRSGGAAVHQARRKSHGQGGQSADRAAGHRARYLSSRCRPLSDVAGRSCTRSIKSPAESTVGTDPISKKKCRRIPGASPISTRAPATMARTISFPTAPTACRAATAITVTLRAGKGNRGFSLLELVLVLLLDRRQHGSSCCPTSPGVSRNARCEPRLSAWRQRRANLRSRALFDGEPQQLVINLPQNSYLVARSREVRLPGEVRFISVEGGEGCRS